MSFRPIVSLGLSLLLAAGFAACRSQAPEETPVTIPSWDIPNSIAADPASSEPPAESPEPESEPVSSASTQKNPPELEGIQAQCTSNLFTGVVTQVEVAITNDSGRLVSYKNTVTVEAYRDNAWVELPWGEARDITPTAYVLETGRSGSFQVDMSQLADGPLTQWGAYRIIIPALSDGKEEEYTLTAYFNIK